MTSIKEVLPRRSDLSTFIVHLSSGNNAKENLKGIINDKKIEARNSFGHKKDLLEQNQIKCVCFTETPLEHLYMFCADIEGKQNDYKPYGIAITKKLARQNKVNPILYIDMTKGHDWLTQPLDSLAVYSNENAKVKEDLNKFLPFIDHMLNQRNADGTGTLKEFWWEREWRHVGDFTLPEHFIGLCPETEIEEFEGLVNHSTRFIDPCWGLEKIIARLAGFNDQEIDIL